MFALIPVFVGVAAIWLAGLFASAFALAICLYIIWRATAAYPVLKARAADRVSSLRRKEED
jgi:hypothetical protein